MTRVSAGWLGFRVLGTFEPDVHSREAHVCARSFKLSVPANDLTWLDRELNLRIAIFR